MKKLGRVFRRRHQHTFSIKEVSRRISLLVGVGLILVPLCVKAAPVYDGLIAPYYKAEGTDDTCSTATQGGEGGATTQSGTVGNVSKDGNPFHILTYPPITDEAGAAQTINEYIKNGWPKSPFVGLGNAFIVGGKQYNVNPFLAVGHLQQENGFATASDGWHTTTPPSYNAFGRTASQSQPHTIYTTGSGRQRLVYQWPSWEASLTASDSWFAYIRRGYLNIGSPYESPDFETYISHYAPQGDGNDEAGYIASLFSTIDKLSGTVNPGLVSSVSLNCGQVGSLASIPSTAQASQYITDCSANNGDAAIACTAINQLIGIPYSAPQRAAPTDPNPKFLDCSAFTGMAIYRTFGVNLGGLCSVGYKTNSNFEIIDVHDIQAGDLIGKGTACSTVNESNGHIAVVVSYDKTAKKLITVEASSTSHPSGLRGIGGKDGYNVGLSADGNGDYEWAVRYIGPKVLQPGAL